VADKGTSAALAHLSEKDRAKFMDPDTGLEMEQAAEPKMLLEWLAEKYRDFGANLEFITNKSQEGSQFVKGVCEGRIYPFVFGFC
jgi:peptide chain release factor subunit 1